MVLAAARLYTLASPRLYRETWINHLKIKLTRYFLASLILCFTPSFTCAQVQSGDISDTQLLAEFPKYSPDANQDSELKRDHIPKFNIKLKEQQGARQEQRPPPTHANLAYGEHERQVFDIWLIPSKKGKSAPLVIYIHGGGFRSGNKNSFSTHSLRLFQKAGFSFAAIHYRLSDIGPYPIMMEDAARCLQTIRARAGEWNIDPGKVACYGGSAGAGISLWLAFHDDLADPDGDDPIARQSTRITAAGSMDGQPTYDLRTFRKWFKTPDLPSHPVLLPFYGVAKQSDWDSKRVRRRMKEASAITHLTKDDGPVYMTYMGRDVEVDKDTEPGIWVHHVKLGLKLQEAMTGIGLECRVKSPDYPEETYGSLEAFLIAKLTE